MIPQIGSTPPLQNSLGPTRAACQACPQCGAIDPPAVGPGSGPHTASARCRYCGHFIRWLSTCSPAERQARRPQALAARPPSQAQLNSLQALGDDGPMPATMLEASTRIDARVRGEVA